VRARNPETGTIVPFGPAAKSRWGQVQVLPTSRARDKFSSGIRGGSFATSSFLGKRGERDVGAPGGDVSGPKMYSGDSDLAEGLHAD